MTSRVAVHLQRRRESQLVGHLLEADRQIFFEYAPTFLATGLELSPFKLPLRSGVFQQGVPEFLGLPGLFFDSVPDGWGLLLMHRKLRERGNDPERVSPLSMLRYLGDRPMGALTYHPVDGPDASTAMEVDLESLSREAQAVIEGSADVVLPELEMAGGSPGGARPKVVVAIGPGHKMVAGSGAAPRGYEHWLVKFSSKADNPDSAELEETYARLASKAGITMPETHLYNVGKKASAFAVKRFDRIGHQRIHIHTLGGLLHANHRTPSLDYRSYLQATQALTRQHPEVLEAFRRMTFNALACNRDDHVRNFAFQMSDSGEWSLSPAYDLTFTEGIRGHHTMSFLGETSRPSRFILRNLASEMSISTKQADSQIDQVESALANFRKTGRSVGVSEAALKRVEKRLSEIRKDFQAPATAARV